MIQDIVRYLSYLENECRLYVSVHFRVECFGALSGEMFSALLPYNRHKNAYCIEVKKEGMARCLASQKEIMSGESTPYLRTCHAGVCEHITPVLSEKEIIGFIAVSGFRQKESLPPKLGKELWQASLSEEDFPLALTEAVIPPLKYMLERLFSKYAVGDGDEYGMILALLHDRRGCVTLNELCHHFHRSRSYLSRIFNERAGCSLSVYCNRLKLEDAKDLLEQTHLSVTEIAYASGFGDTSYFIKQFKKRYGASPLRYRSTSK